MEENNIDTGLIRGYLLDGTGAAKRCGWEAMQSWDPAQGLLWLHLDYTDPEVENWILNKSGLDPLVAEALLTEETRPRTTAIGNGLLIALRGVNLNPGSEPNDMVSIRLWVDQSRMISTRKRPLFSARDVADQLEAGKGPIDAAGLLVEFIDRLIWRMSDTVEEVEDLLDGLEEEVLTSSGQSLRSRLTVIRRQTISLRRYLAPQRDALGRLITEKIAWLEEGSRLSLRETNDRLIRYIEDLDAFREREAILQEELLSRMSEQLNTRMYVLSLIAAVFLPLGFLTGLLGINVGGIPGATHDSAFYVFIGFLVIVVGIELSLFRWKKWF